MDLILIYTTSIVGYYHARAGPENKDFGELAQKFCPNLMKSILYYVLPTYNRSSRPLVLSSNYYSCVSTLIGEARLRCICIVYEPVTDRRRSFCSDLKRSYSIPYMETIAQHAI